MACSSSLHRQESWTCKKRCVSISGRSHHKTYRDETKPRKQKLSMNCSLCGYLQMQAKWYHAALASPQLQWSFIPRRCRQNVMSLWSKGNYLHQSWTITRRKSRRAKIQTCSLHGCRSVTILSLLSSFFLCHFCNIFSPSSHLNKEPLFQKCPKTFSVVEINNACRGCSRTVKLTSDIQRTLHV